MFNGFMQKVKAAIIPCNRNKAMKVSRYSAETFIISANGGEASKVMTKIKTTLRQAHQD